MATAVKIAFEPLRHLTQAQELALFEETFARRPSPTLRSRLADLLAYHDDNEAIIALFAEERDLSLSEELLLGEAWLAQESPSGDEAARAAASRAVVSAQTPPSRAAALALRGKAEIRLGEIAAARATLAEALALDPHNKDACKRLAALDFAANDADAVVALSDALTARGAAHARLFAARALADARQGRHDAARRMMGADRFFGEIALPPPPGWDTIDAFNDALAHELTAHPELRYDRYGAASQLTWRIDTMLNAAAPLSRVLLESIAAAVQAHVAGFAPADHPWADARPDQALLRSWCVITESEGFETWHVHQFGWLSGAYYVRVPESIAGGEGEGGCIAFGLPEDLAGEAGAAAYGLRLVRPRSGLLLLFPSHTYHRTFPHGVQDQRICVAFDIKPRAVMSESLDPA